MPPWLLETLRQALGHDLPNQLVAVLGLVRLLELEEGARLSNDGRDFMDRLRTAAERSHAWVLALAEIIQAVRVAETPEEVALAELVDEIAAALKQTGAGGSAWLACDILVPAVTAPPRRLRRVLLEVLRQAVQPADQGAPLVRVCAEPSAASIAIRIEDNGGGLVPDLERRVFAPRAPGEDEGLGLGLVLARALAESWGGSLTIQSEPGRGNTFTIVIPDLVVIPSAVSREP